MTTTMKLLILGAPKAVGHVLKCLRCRIIPTQAGVGIGRQKGLFAGVSCNSHKTVSAWIGIGPRLKCIKKCITEQGRKQARLGAENGAKTSVCYLSLNRLSTVIREFVNTQTPICATN